jgi:endonuclease/exonuclease/phosphatase family metal-dependent hydrolase
MRLVRRYVALCELIIFCGVVLPVGTSSQAAAPDQLRILTYNVYTALGAPGAVERIEFMAQDDILRGYDVLILNELFRDDTADYLLDAFSEAYPYRTPVLGRDALVDSTCAANTCWNSAEGQTINTQVEDGGVAILSRWPIIDRRQVVYGARCGIDALSRKGFVYAVLDVDGTLVHVIGTHLQADPTATVGLDAAIEGLFACAEPEVVAAATRCSAAWSTPYTAVRVNQLAELDGWIMAQEIASDEMVVIGGDFNIDRMGATEEYTQMLCLLRVSAPLYGGDPALGSPWYTFDGVQNALLDSGAGQFYLDYVLVREDFAQPAQWHNYVQRFTASPDNWDGDAPRGYELSDHFAVSGFIMAE